MRILINGLGANRGGFLTYLEEMLPLLGTIGSNHEYFFLLSSAQRRLKRIALPGNFKRLEIGERWRVGVARLVWEQIGLSQIVRDERIHLAWLPLSVTALRVPCPMVVDIRNSNLFAPIESKGIRYAVLNGAKREITKIVASRAAKVVFVSKWSADAATDALGLDRSKAVVIHHGIDSGFGRSSSSHRLNPQIVIPPNPYMLTVSTIEGHKNYPRAVEAYAMLARREGAEIDYVIVGGVGSRAELARIRRIVEDYKIDDRVHLLGEIPRNDLPFLYRKAILYFAPSLLETFGHPVLEAMTCRTPVVASNAAAIPEIVGNAAIYFDPYDTESMVRAIQSVSNSHLIRAKLVSRGQARVKDFSWHGAAQKLIQVFEEVMRSESSKGEHHLRVERETSHP